MFHDRLSETCNLYQEEICGNVWMSTWRNVVYLQTNYLQQTHMELRNTFLIDSVNEAACMVNQRQMGIMENVSS